MPEGPFEKWRPLDEGAPVEQGARQPISGLITTTHRNTVIALREIAEKVVSGSDMREGFIESLQENTEVDEPEAAAAPALPPAFQPPRLGRDDPSVDPQIDVMTEDALLRAMKSQIQQELNPAGDKPWLIAARIAGETHDA